MRAWLLVVVAGAWSLIAFAQERPWRDHAGNPLHATPLALQASTQSVRFRLTDGTEATYPLSAFPPDEQLRLRLALGEVPIPPALAERWDRVQYNIRRARKLVAAGRLTPERAEEQIRIFREGLLKALDRHPNLTPEHASALRARAQAL